MIYRQSGWLALLSDIDECTQGTDDCDPASMNCTNSVGGFSCSCHDDGFVINGGDCDGECCAGNLLKSDDNTQ